MLKILVLALIAISLINVSCDRRKYTPVEQKPQTEWDQVLAKKDLYVELGKSLLDEKGWYPGCDGLLWNSLARYSGIPIDVYQAESAPGEWRRTWNFDVCKPQASPESASCISRDMFRGLFVVLLAEKNIDALKRIRSYGEDKNWFMGCSKDWITAVSRTYFSPSIRNQLNRMIDPSSPKIFQQAEEDDFEDHLSFLDVYAEFLIYGKINSSELATIKKLSERYPRNALYQGFFHKFSDGDQTIATEILLDTTLFPMDRLPMDTDRFSDYIFQRDQDENWQPCNPDPAEQKFKCEGKVHPGIDYIFAVAAIEK